ncbi:unnamed protein product [Xylocopa violacea]|uniref:Cytochrome c oxidase assembly protein COX20, mitochondrial n=1 Tax=Xylocopa violacea TaxID=135666 RepID=A0ABP1N504_XYLVO
MENFENKEEEKPAVTSFTIFGEPVIKTRCQRNALISAISGGIFTGLLSFLFTSNAQKSTNIGVFGFGVIGIIYSCYCAYDEIETRKAVRAIRKAMYEAELQKTAKKT